MKTYNIIGQGLAGSLLAYFLIKKGQKVMIYDNNHESSATAVAAGLINPITGRRIVKSENIDELLPFAEKTYKEIEIFLGEKLWYPREILWTLSDIKEENDWAVRSSIPEVQNYIGENNDDEKDKVFFKKALSFGVVKNAAQVDLSLLINAFRHYFISKNCLKNERYDFTNFDNHTITIFCEGEKARFNPLWSWLPFNVAKGEALHLDIQNTSFEKIIKNNISVIPIKNGEKQHYWVGSNYEWKPENTEHTELYKTQFLQDFDSILDVKYEVLAHKAAIRPATKDRKPFLGAHPNHSNLFIFNGLGTKGTSLAPYWANHLSEVLVDRVEVDKMVSINRYSNLLL